MGTNSRHETPLQYAVKTDQLEIVQLLLRYGADVSILPEGVIFESLTSDPRLKELISRK